MPKKISLLLSLLLSFSDVLAEEFKFDPKTSKAVPIFAGKVLISRGENLKISKGQADEILLQQGDGINPGDLIKTQKASFVKIQMSDDTTINVGPNSSLHVDRFEMKSKQDRVAHYQLLEGKMSANFEHKSKKEGQLAVKTKFAVMGIRGTFLYANHQAGEQEVTQFFLDRGQAEIKTSQGKILKAHSGIHYIFQKDNQEVEKIDPKEWEELRARENAELSEASFLKNKLYALAEDTAQDRSRVIEYQENETVKRERPIKDWREKLMDLNKKLKE